MEVGETTDRTALLRQIEALTERLSRVSEAGPRINERLDFDTVLQEVLDSAQVLTETRCGVITAAYCGGTGIPR